MPRSKSSTDYNLRLRAPAFVDAVDRMAARQVLDRLGFDVDVEKPGPPMFQPFRLRGMTLANRLVLSPMCQYSAVDGCPTDWHMVHLGARALGGAGLIDTEMTDVSEEARSTHACAGISNDGHAGAWRRIVALVHATTAARICLRRRHAGRQGS